MSSREVGGLTGVRRSHHNTIRISQWLISRIIDVEHTSPHGRPEIIRLEPKQQLKDMRVEIMIKPRPIRPRRIMITPHVSKQRQAFGSKTYLIQLVNAGCSSLTKNPRYFTLGLFCTFLPFKAQTPSCFLTGTSAHHHHGETPICSLISYNP